MKLGIMQPYFFPYIGYWQLMNAVDKYIIYDDVNFIKRGWINRNQILCEGKKKWINLPIQKMSQNKLIKDTYIVENREDIKKLLRTIEYAYKKAPNFEQVYELMQEILSYENNNLAHFLFHHHKCICSYLGIHTELILSSDIEKNLSKKGEEKILDICEREGATTYINAIGGKELYKKEHFNQKNIQLEFLNTNDIQYKQYNNDFISGLSIIDVAMFNDVNKIKEYLYDYELEE